MHSGRGGRKEGRGEGEHDGPCDTGSATAGCYVSAPPALASHRLSRRCFWPIPHPVAAAHFFSLSTHMAPHMAASLHPSPSPLLSHHLFLSLPSTHLHPRGATNLCCLCCHSLCVLSVCLSFSHYFQWLLSLPLCCAVRLQLHTLDYRDMTDGPRIRAQARSDTPTPTFHRSLSLSGFSNTLCCFFRRRLSLKLDLI